MDTIKNKLLGIQRHIFWIDQDLEKDENKHCLEILKKEFPLPLYEIQTFISMKTYKSFIKKENKKYEFKLIYYIVSGRLADKFFESYNKSKRHSKIIAATIVYCGNKNYYSSKPYASDLYLNPGGVVTNFNEVIRYIRSENDILWHNLINMEKTNIILPEEKQNFGNTFEYAESLTDVTLPIIFTEIIKKNMIQNMDIIQFNNYIFSKYLDNSEIISLIKPSLEKSIDLPLKKRALFLLKLYTKEAPKEKPKENPFYKVINKELTNIDDFGLYKVYILILYFSIQNKVVESYSSGKLYRRTLMSIKEMEEIIKRFEEKKINIEDENKISSILYIAKPFMSFSKHKSKAQNFAKTIYPNTVRVTFILNPPKHSGEIYYPNIDIDKLKISEYDESEVLFLPLSCFEIESYKKIKENDYEITLNYLDKYYLQLKNIISNMKDEKKILDFYLKILISPFSKKVCECLKDTDVIFTFFNNIKEYFQDHSPFPQMSLNSIKIIPELPHEKVFGNVNENCSMKGISSGFSNGKQLNALYNSEPVSIQLQENRSWGYKVWELKYADGSKAIISPNNRGEIVIIKKIDENGNLGYYDEAFRPISEEINIENINTKEIKINSKDFDLTKVKELSLLRNGFAFANLFGSAIGYNLANIDKFMKSSKTEKAVTLGSTFGIPTGMYLLSNTLNAAAIPFISFGILGGFYIYEVASDIKSSTLTKKETAISILKNTSNIAVNIGTGLGGFYAGLQIGVSLGIVTGPGVILLGLGSGIVGGLIGGLAGRLITSTKMVLNCNSFYKNYIPHKFREEGNIPDLFWKGVSKKAKSFVLEAIIDRKDKIWCVINIPRKTRKIAPGIGETLIEYRNFWQCNPNTVDYLLYSINKKEITKEEWKDQNKNKELIIDVAILEVNNL